MRYRWTWYIINYSVMYSSAIKKILVSRILSMEEVESWLAEHRSLYRMACQELKKSDKDLVTLPSGIKVKRLFFLDEEPDWFKLYHIYNELEEIAGFHRYESYFKEEMERYQAIKSSRKLQQEWLRKNLKLGTDKFSIFEPLYFDYEGCEDFGEDKCPLGLYISGKTDLRLFIDRNDFKYTLEFIHLFHELFYDKNLLPNCLERIQADFIDFKKFRLN